MNFYEVMYSACFRHKHRHRHSFGNMNNTCIVIESSLWKAPVFMNACSNV